jgi:hypothetical protein
MLVGTMVATLDLQVEVVGCPTVCRHCWAQGVPYPATTGVPLAVREDWQELLATAATLGTTTVWVAFHGLGVEHDRQVNRPGAFTETCLAIQRVHAVGLRAGANVFITTANAGQADQLLEALQRLDVDEMAWEPAAGHRSWRSRSHATAASGCPWSAVRA